MAGRKPRPEKKKQMLKLSETALSLIRGESSKKNRTLSDTVEDIIMRYFADSRFDDYAGTGQVVGADMELEFAVFGPYFIRGRHSRTEDGLTINPASPYTYFVLHAEDGKYAGSCSDGSDCAFSSLEEAFAYMKRRVLAARDRRDDAD